MMIQMCLTDSPCSTSRHHNSLNNISNIKLNCKTNDCVEEILSLKGHCASV